MSRLGLRGALAPIAFVSVFALACGGVVEEPAGGQKAEVPEIGTARAAALVPVAGCTDGTFQSRDYRYCSAFVSWAEARDRCRTYGLELVKISSAAENTFVNGFGTLVLPKWIGATDAAVENTWVWSADSAPFFGGTAPLGAPIGGAYENFPPWEPVPDGGALDCANIRPFTAAAWLSTSCSELSTFVCERPPVQVATSWAFNTPAAAPLVDQAPRAGGGALVSTARSVVKLSATGAATTLFSGAAGLSRARPVLAPTGDAYAVMFGRNVSLFSDTGATLSTLPTQPLDYVRITPTSRKLFFPLLQQRGVEDRVAVSGRVFETNGTQSGTFPAAELDLSRVTSTHVYVSDRTVLRRRTLAGAQVWQATTALRTFEVATGADRVIGVPVNAATSVVHVVNGAVSAPVSLGGPIWNLAVAPAGVYSVATTQTAVHVFSDGVLKSSLTLPGIAFVNSVAISNRGEVLTGAQTAGNAGRMFMTNEFGGTLWQATAEVDPHAYRPELRFAPDSTDRFYGRVKSGLVSYAITRSP